MPPRRAAATPGRTESATPGPAPGRMTDLLVRWRSGDAEARDELLREAYPQLKRMAAGHFRRQPAGHVLQATALVHEAYLKLAAQVIDWKSRGHFYGLMSIMMRRILVDHARARRRRGYTTSLDDVHVAAEGPVDVLDLNEALTRMEKVHPFEARVVELRYFGGLSILESADALDVSHATVERAFTLAKAWLYRELGGEGRRGSGGR